MNKLYRPYLLVIFCLVYVAMYFLLLKELPQYLQNRSNSAEITDIVDTAAVEAFAETDDFAAATQAERAQKEWDEFTSTDLKTFFVKGHVKEIVYGTDYITTIRFSEEGKLTYHSKYQDQEYQHQYKRNSKGQLTDLLLKDSWAGGDEGETYKYNADGYPCFHSNWCSDTITEEYTQYDENHWPTRGEGYEGGAPITYTYPAVDDHGNWTTQKTTVHYSKIFEGAEDQIYTEQRTIKYYDFHK